MAMTAEGRKQALYDELLPRLDNVRGREGGNVTARCPAHEDRHNSLTLSPEIGVKCQAGCTFESILEAAGVQPALPGLSERTGSNRKIVNLPVNRNGRKFPAGPPTREYEYKDETGRKVIAVKGRWNYPDDSKEIMWRQPHATWDDVRSGKGGTVETRDMPMWNIQALVQAPPDEVVYIVEGEKACDAACQAGLLAVSFSNGAAQTTFGDRNLELLRGRTIALWPDNDPQGRILMRKLEAELDRIAKAIRHVIVDLGYKEDAYDYFVKHKRSVKDIRDQALAGPVTEYLSRDCIQVRIPHSELHVVIFTFDGMLRNAGVMEVDVAAGAEVSV